jgi:FtsP/CotA-like multicopper oxidase with cupredoxin domain
LEALVHPSSLSRRRFLLLSTGGALTLAACDRGDGQSSGEPSGTKVPVQSDDPIVTELEARRTPGNPRVVTAGLAAAPMALDLAGRRVDTWGYSGALPGPLLRATAGDVLEVKLRNDLPEATSIHWHGVAVRNDMDGVNDMTQLPIRPGQDFTYRFALAHPGTYWFHPHVGLQLDRGLYAPLIVDDPAEPGRYDAEHVLVLDDWLDGFDTTPDQVFTQLRTMGHGSMDGMEGMDHGSGAMNHPMALHSRGPRVITVAVGEEGHGHGEPAPVHPTSPGSAVPGAAMGRFSSPALGGDAGDVAYALHLINGRPPQDRPTFDAPPSGRVRFRIINAGSDTAYRFAIGGHRLTVTHTDGFPIAPVEVDAIIIGMGERYDVTVTATPGAWPVVATAEGKDAIATAVLRTHDAQATEPPPVDARPVELDRQLLDYRVLRAAEPVRLGGAPEQTVDVDLTGDMATYKWGFTRSTGTGEPIEIEQGRRVRLNLHNRTTMWHPVHLHGHTVALAEPSGGGARKDNINVLPGQTIAVDLHADNPGQWMIHCHNTYHLEAGMATTLSYVRSP